METGTTVVEEGRRLVVKIGRREPRRLKAGVNMYTATMPVEQVLDLMDPRYTKKADF